NRAAGELIAALPDGVVHACTDVTGFGLMGHASEMAAASGYSLDIVAASVPLLEGARELVSGNVPGGGRTNRQHFGARIAIDPSVDPGIADLLFDPQTSGGLLVAIDPAAADSALAALQAIGVPAVEIGDVHPDGGLLIRVR
ncbi:MAG: AIR synthase-related protein, partial [Acidobacteriota bacterium]|nr:AIR synthase-related protein [Acidobacteriota bacterium]